MPMTMLNYRTTIRVSIVPLSTILIFDFGTVSTV